MCLGGQNGEILERPHLCLQFGEVGACECLDNTLGRTFEGGEVFMESIGIVVGVERVETVVLDGIESGVLCEQLLVLLMEGELAGQEEAFVIWVISPQPTEGVFQLFHPLLHLLALL